MIFTIPEVLVNFAMIKFAEDVLTKAVKINKIRHIPIIQEER
jgi:hypothetical protein